ncbi:EAL domain-containing protein [Roseibium sp.]|uniref:EAL domain-containing response regulator n=1 Tax=Roseibium sp. TaxID=1936156 RepID=UPI003BAC57BF
MKCLIVDDEQNFAEFVEDALNNFGIQVTKATSSSEFCQVYSDQFDLIIIDLYMPGMDGLQILRFLHENGSGAGIILISGQHKSLLNSAVELGNEWGSNIVGSLQKPFTVNDLKELVETFDGHRQWERKQPGKSITPPRIAASLLDGEFRLLYQPLVCAKTLKVLGAEALIRWDDPDGGRIGPDFFIPVAEASGQIGPINQFVAETAIFQLAHWVSAGLDISISINMSPASIADINMPERLTELVTANNLEPERVTIELTETAIMTNVADYIDLFTRLRMRGFELAIDDFGVGHSSLRQLVRMPFTKMKIDRSFVSAAYDNEERLTVARMATMLAHELGMEVVAEGVEDERTLRLMNEIHCDVVQGFLIARPMPPKDFHAWCARRSIEKLPARAGR